MKSNGKLKKKKPLKCWFYRENHTVKNFPSSSMVVRWIGTGRRSGEMDIIMTHLYILLSISLEGQKDKPKVHEPVGEGVRTGR